MIQIEHNGKTKYFTILPVLLYVSISEIFQSQKIIGQKAYIVGIHITPWLGFGISITKSFNKAEEL